MYDENFFRLVYFQRNVETQYFLIAPSKKILNAPMTDACGFISEGCRQQCRPNFVAVLKFEGLAAQRNHFDSVK